MFHLFQRWSSSAKQLPEAVYVELVDILYTPLVPVAFIGAAVLCLGTLIAIRKDDPLTMAMTLAGVLISVARLFLVLLYRRRRAISSLDRQEAAVWETRFAVASCSLAAVIGALDVRAMTIEHTQNPMLVPMLVTGLIYGYGAGVVTRQSVRPVICIASLALATIPTVIGFIARIFTETGGYATAVFVVQALLMVGFSLAGLESVAQIYRTTRQQLTSKLDLAVLAGKDDLTGLPNRVTLRLRFQEAASRARVSGKLIALHCLDLDRFKAVNDTFGHPTGDLLLQAVVERLKRALREEDTIARLGGDEFVVVQPGIKHADEARLLAHRIVHVVSAPYKIDGKEIHIGVSIGIAIASPKDLNLEQFIARSDAALYESKAHGRGTITLAGETDLHPAVITAA